MSDPENFDTLAIFISVCLSIALKSHPFSNLFFFQISYLLTDMLCVVSGYYSNISDKTMSTTAMNLVVLFGWLLSTAVAAGPLIGWNRYRNYRSKL